MKVLRVVGCWEAKSGEIPLAGDSPAGSFYRLTVFDVLCLICLYLFMHTSLISIPGIISCMLLLLWTISLSLPYLHSSEDALLGAKSTQAGNTDQRLRGFSEPEGVVVSHGLG